MFRIQQNNNIELEQQQQNSRETKRNETKILLKTECKEISMRYYLKKHVTKQL